MSKIYKDGCFEATCTVPIEVMKPSAEKQQWFIKFDNACLIVHRFDNWMQRLALPDLPQCSNSKQTVWDGASAGVLLHAYTLGRDMNTWGDRSISAKYGRVVITIGSRSTPAQTLTLTGWAQAPVGGGAPPSVVAVVPQAPPVKQQKQHGAKNVAGLSRLLTGPPAVVKIHDQVLRGPVKNSSAISFGGGATVDIKNVTVLGPLEGSARGLTSARVDARDVMVVDGDYDGFAVSGASTKAPATAKQVSFGKDTEDVQLGIIDDRLEVRAVGGMPDGWKVEKFMDGDPANGTGCFLFYRGWKLLASYGKDPYALDSKYPRVSATLDDGTIFVVSREPANPGVASQSWGMSQVIGNAITIGPNAKQHLTLKLLPAPVHGGGAPPAGTHNSGAHVNVSGNISVDGDYHGAAVAGGGSTGNDQLQSILDDLLR